MKETYHEAMQQVYADEGGYSNDANDPGGPTKYGITIWDARKYWKADASAEDVRNMPKSVAEEIYEKHYAGPIQYDNLPPGVDYAILDYGINSGISRAVRVAQGIVGAHQDGVMGPETIADINKYDPSKLVKAIYKERLNFLQHLRTWSSFGKGWGRRCANGQKLALSLITKYYKQPKKETTPMLNWKTTLSGVAAICTALGALLAQLASGSLDLTHLIPTLSSTIAGIGLIFAKDFNVSSSQPATPPTAVAAPA